MIVIRLVCGRCSFCENRGRTDGAGESEGRDRRRAPQGCDSSPTALGQPLTKPDRHDVVPSFGHRALLLSSPALSFLPWFYGRRYLPPRFSVRIGYRERTSSNAMATLKPRRRPGLLMNRPSPVPNAAQTPTLGTTMRPNTAATTSTFWKYSSRGT